MFRRAYAAAFSASFLDEPLEIVTWKVEAVGPEALLSDGFRLSHGADSGAALKGHRQAYFTDAYQRCPVYERALLEPDTEVSGPALIEERESTCVIGPGDAVRVDARRNLIAELGAA